MSQEAARRPLWALVPDLFLRVKLEAMARGEGRDVRAFPTPAALLAALAARAVPAAPSGTEPALVLVDLAAPHDAGFTLLEALAAHHGAPPTLAYFSHVDLAAKQRATAAGATRVVPRSALVARFAELVDEVSGEATGPG